MSPRSNKPSEPRCPTCSTPASRTPGGSARRAAEAAQSAHQDAQAARQESQAQRQQEMQRRSMAPQMPSMQRPPMQQPQGGIPPQVAALIQRITQQQPGGGLARAIQSPQPAAPSSPTGARPGQIEQEVLKRALEQRMLDQQRGGR